MTKLEKCPICGGYECSSQRGGSFWGDLINCQLGFSLTIEDSINVANNKKKMYNLIYEKLIKNPYKLINDTKRKWHFFYDEGDVGKPIDEPEKVNIANDMRNYPEDFMEKMDRILINLSVKYKMFGECIICNASLYRLLFCEFDIEEEISGIFSCLSELGYVKFFIQNIYIITADGWKRISELKKKEQEINQGFIAMWFDNTTKQISETFKQAINNCGYIPRRIDEVEHNNQIVPEIFFEIKRSKFVVVDVTYPNSGAYYEAGYAEALGKQVIVCCREDKFNAEDKTQKPHFDISQKSMIVWKDEQDLLDRLTKRIEATVGKNILTDGNI